MQYTDLTTEEQEQLLAQRKKQYEGEHFNHAVNLELLEATGATDEQTMKAIQTAKDAMKTLDVAHETTAKKLKAIQAKKPKS